MRRKTLLLTLLCLLAWNLRAQDEAEEKRVTGWNNVILPSLGLSSDSGFQYGLFGEIYYYGDGSTYPDPVHQIKWTANHSTQGRTRLNLLYDSKYLIPGMRVTALALFVDDPLYRFYGFNGAASPFTKELKAVRYFNLARRYFQSFVNLQGDITENLKWAAGISYWSFHTQPFNDAKYGGDAANSLYSRYVVADIIKEHERDGGRVLELRAGLAYDSRDREAAPNRGILADAYLNGAPDLFGSGAPYLKACFHWAQFLTVPFGLPAGDPVFAYRISYQGTVAGEAPFYMQQVISALVPKKVILEGLGGSSTIRGIYANRVVADDYFWGNFELRTKLFRFNFRGGDVYVAVNPFFDCGFVPGTYRISEMAAMAGVTPAEIRAKARELVRSAGAGLKIAYNENFILSAEMAHCFNPGFGDPVWFNFGTSYSF